MSRSDVKMMFLDVETTGLNPRLHCIHQLSGRMYIDDVLMNEFDYRIKPHERAGIDNKALEVCGVEKAAILKYPHRKDVWPEFYENLKHVDKYDAQDKIFFVAYNAHFDNTFMRKFFEQCGEKWFGSFFWSGTIDVMVLALQYLKKDRHLLPNFKLMTVAKHLGVKIDESKAHDSLYDIVITKEVYDIVTNGKN